MPCCVEGKEGGSGWHVGGGVGWTSNGFLLMEGASLYTQTYSPRSEFQDLHQLPVITARSGANRHPPEGSPGAQEQSL